MAPKNVNKDQKWTFHYNFFRLQNPATSDTNQNMIGQPRNAYETHVRETAEQRVSL